MPDETQVIDTPVETPDHSEFFNDAGSRFEESKAAAVAATETKATEKAAAAPKTPAEAPETETGADIPDEVLMGEKAVKKEEVEEDIPTPEFRSPEKRAQWDKLSTRATKYRTERDALQKRIAEMEGRSSQPVDTSKYEDEVKTYRTRATELEAALEKAAFQESPRYKGFPEKEQANIDAAKAVIDGGDIPKRIIDIAASQTGAERLKTLRESGADAETIVAIMPYFVQADSIRRDREAALANFRDERAREMAAEAERQKDEIAQRKEKDAAVFGKVLDFALKEMKEFQKVDGAVAWNSQIDESLEQARKLFEGGEGISEELVAFGAVRAAAYNHSEAIRKKQAIKIAELQARVSELTAAQPDLNGGNKDGRQNQPVDPNAPFSYDEAGERFAQDPRLQR